LSIRLKNMDFSYDDNPVFSKLNLDIPANCWTMIIGDCGTGKTTLAKLIAGLLKPESGEIEFPWKNDNGKRLDKGYIFQTPDDQIVQLNLEREVAFSLENNGEALNKILHQVEESLKEIGLWSRRLDSPNNLSGGQKQNLALSSTLITKPKLLILDEPTSFLDIVSRVELYRRMQKILLSKVSIIWITQDRDEFYLADHIVKLEKGGIAFTGSKREFFKRNQILHEA